MKKAYVILAMLAFVLDSCTPSDSAIQAAISRTQSAQTEMAFSIQTAISQTMTAAPTKTQVTAKQIISTPTRANVATLPKPTVKYYPPTATAIKKPTLQPTLSHPVLDITIKVINQCAEQHTVIFDGPVHLKYVVDAGRTVEWQAARGTYSWTVDGFPGQQSPMDLNVAVWELTLCY